MKKIISLISIIALTLSLSACGKKGPEDTVKTFSDALKAFDLKKAATCMVNSEDSDLSEIQSDEDMSVFSKYLTEWAKKITYTVGEVKTDGDRATVSVNYQHTDSSKIVGEALKNYLTEAITAAFSGQEMTEQEMNDLMLRCLEDAVKASQPGSMESKVDFSLVNVNNEWKISDYSDNLLDVLTSNMLSGIEDLGAGMFDDDSFGEDFD